MFLTLFEKSAIILSSLKLCPPGFGRGGLFFERAVARAGRMSQGWTLEARADFVERLARTGNVSEAARSIGLSRSHAYKLKATDPSFAAAWSWAYSPET